MTLCDVVLLLIVVSIVFLKALLQIYFLQSFVPNESRIQLKGVSFLSEEKGREEPNRGRNNNKRWEAAFLPSLSSGPPAPAHPRRPWMDWRSIALSSSFWHASFLLFFLAGQGRAHAGDFQATVAELELFPLGSWHCASL